MHGASRRSLLIGAAALAGCAAPPRTSARAAAPAKPAPPPPADLQARLTEIASSFDGRFGVAVRDLAAGWTAGFDGARLYPQQSVAKLWTALAVFDAIDHGRLQLEQTVRVSAADMSVFHQPLRARVLSGPVDVSVDALLTAALAQSDNAADDVLIRLVGGDRVVQRAVDARGLGAIRAGPQEHDLQSWIAGLDWRPEYAVGDAFERARDRVPAEMRRARMTAYLADPPEGAAPDALTRALGLLSQGRLLSPASTARFLEILQSTTTGPNRLKAGLTPGWSFAHKTGTGQDFAGLSTGYNDVGIATAPDGRVFTLAAMMAATGRTIPERMLAMQAVSRALAEWVAGSG
ncbi:MAG: serine hydrolase [Caulobacteraceae bacterium]|nr:serine hydrolase [Caulobacter sp.]